MARTFFPCLSASLAITCSLTATARQVEGILLADKDVLVSARTENVIISIDVEEGQEIRQDQLLAVLDPRTQQLQVNLWEKRLELLEVAYQSALNLSRDNIVSREETLTAEIERDLARIQLDLARAALEDTELRSAIDGIVVEIFQEPGELVQRGEEMFRIVNTDIVFLQLFLTSDDAAGLQLGQEMTVAFPESSGIESRKATVDFLDPSIDPNSGFQRVRLEIPNPENILKAGQRCRVILPSPR